MAQELYWYGPGVLTYKGKDIVVGDKLPADLAKDTVGNLVAKKKAGPDKPAVRRTVIPEAPADTDADEKLVRELESANATIAELRDQLEGAEATIAELTEQLEKANATIAELTEQITAPKGKK